MVLRDFWHYLLIDLLTVILKNRDLRYDYTIFSPISGHRWCKKSCPLIGGVRLLESLLISVLISRIKHFSTSIRCSWVVSGWQSHLRLWKERNDVNLTQNNTVILVIYRFYGQEKLVNWLIKKIEAVKKEVECKGSKTVQFCHFLYTSF